MPENSLLSLYTEEAEVALFDPAHDLWAQCNPATIDRFWYGKSALQDRGLSWPNLTHVRSLWSGEALFFYFESWFDSLDVDSSWDTKDAVENLSDKDVVEAFLRPEGAGHYYEFEVSPLGQWLDARILKPRVNVDFHWHSNLMVKANVDEDEGIWRAFLGVPYEPMRVPVPGVGTAWRLNLFRVGGQGPDREYLAWRPTFTEHPDFHAPWAFGHLIFLGGV
jgi:hypothetical protein